MTTDTDNALIKKEMLCPGKLYVPLTAGTRVRFHFQTRKILDGTILDNSRKLDKPMELVLGKKFKLEVWEVIVQKMAVQEVAKFTVNKSTLRDVGRKAEERRHCCGMMSLQNDGIGYKDLDELLAHPSDLEFIIELISAELPEEYEKERWQMTDEERMSATRTLREKGNQLYQQQQYDDAQECYRQAVGLVEQLMLKEKPHEIEWLELAAVKVPLLLNYAQCRLVAKDYYAVIEHCNEVLTLEPNNVKAIFRRAKAHFGAWDPVEAREDFKRAAALDSSLLGAVTKELKAIDEEQRVRDLEDRMKLQKLF